MNVERCVELHNEIVQLGWVGSGRRLEDLDARCKNWFGFHEHCGQEEQTEAARFALSPDMIQFLEQAKMIVPSSPDERLEFFYWVQGLSSPDYMFEFEIKAPESIYWAHKEEDQEEETSSEAESDDGLVEYMVLYAMHSFGSHICGLIYNQRTNRCIISPTIHDMDPIWDGRTKWHPLEDVLEFWLGQVRAGQIKVLLQGRREHPLEYERMWDMKPWVFLTFNEPMLQENLDIFERLVDAIESRLPADSSREDGLIEYGLIDESRLQSTTLPPKFVYEFLRRARRPRFRLIAPGLRILTLTDFLEQPFSSEMPTTDGECPSILLFPHDYTRWSETWSIYEEEACLGYIGKPLSPAGLWLYPTMSTSGCPSTPEDACQLVLPYNMGANGYARKTDGSFFGERLGNGSPKAGKSAVDVYRLGFHPLQEMREQSLAKVLRNWLSMVEHGYWQIDQDGVAGGIDFWREADTEQAWARYVIPYDWEETMDTT